MRCYCCPAVHRRAGGTCGVGWECRWRASGTYVPVEWPMPVVFWAWFVVSNAMRTQGCCRWQTRGRTPTDRNSFCARPRRPGWMGSAWQQANRHVHAHAHARTHARMHARTHARIHARIHTRIHTHAHTHERAQACRLRQSVEGHACRQGHRGRRVARGRNLEEGTSRLICRGTRPVPATSAPGLGPAPATSAPGLHDVGLHAAETSTWHRLAWHGDQVVVADAGELKADDPSFMDKD
jgi:hypothetical protein